MFLFYFFFYFIFRNKWALLTLWIDASFGGTVAWCRYIGNGVGLAVGALLLVMVVVNLPPPTSFTMEFTNFSLPLLAAYTFESLVLQPLISFPEISSRLFIYSQLPASTTLSFIYLAPPSAKYSVQMYKRKKKNGSQISLCLPFNTFHKNMHLRSGNIYHPYPRECQGHSRETVYLRHNRKYQRCLQGHHLNHHPKHRRRVQLKARRRCSWNSLPPELQDEVMTTVLHGGKPLTLLKILRYARICRSWRLRVAEYIYHEEPYPEKLLHDAARNNKVGVVKLLMGRPDFHQCHSRTLKLNSLLRVAASARATDVVRMVLDTPECLQDYVDWEKLISFAAEANALAVVRMVFQRSSVCSYRYQRTNLLHDAVRAKAVDVTRMLLGRFDSPQGSVDRELLLHVAVKANADDVVKMLVDEHDMSVTKIIPCLALMIEYKREWTALHTACFLGHVEMVKLLIERFRALEGKCQQYVNGLARLALRNGQALMFLTLVNDFGADFDCM
jgi:hypothetical protein